MDALPFLAAAKPKRQAIYTLAGDEDFLKRLARERIIATALGGEVAELAVAVYAGEKLDFSTARNDLSTVPFLAPCRIVVVENADPFVTEHRPALEQYAAKPSAAGILILELKSFPETTKLAKALPDAAKETGKSLRADKLSTWCVE